MMRHPMHAASFARCFRIMLLPAVCGMMLSSCSTLQAPLHAPDIGPQEMRRAAIEGIDVGAKAIEAEDEYWQLFEDYLPSIGIVALWVEVHNTSAAAIDLRRSDWSLRIGDRSSAALSADQVFEQYYDGYHVRMYSIQADRKARLLMERAAWQQGRIPPSLRREGFLFFRIDPGMAAGWTRQAILLLRNLRLKPGVKTTLEIVLAHANP
jgi:hypothetical protein